MHARRRHLPWHEPRPAAAAAGLPQVPYEYIVCRQGPETGVPAEDGSSIPSPRESMLVVSGERWLLGATPGDEGGNRPCPGLLLCTGKQMG